MSFPQTLRRAALLALQCTLGTGLVSAQAAVPSASTQPVTYAESVSTVPASRLAGLRHGINASQWFAQVYDNRGYTKEHFQSWTTAEDIALIQAMGFDHVRLSADPKPMMAEDRKST